MTYYVFLLSAVDAAYVAGEYGIYELLPILLNSGDYFLPIEVLNTQDYPVEIRNYIASKPIATITQDDIYVPTSE